MYILGWGLPWRLTTLPGALIPILPILLLALLPETPTWLLGKGRREDALQSLAKYIIIVNNIFVVFLEYCPAVDPRGLSGNDLSLIRLRGLAVDSSVIKEEMRFQSFHCFFLLLEKRKTIKDDREFFWGGGGRGSVHQFDNIKDF